MLVKQAENVLPALAGMSPLASNANDADGGAPRASGDEPPSFMPELVLEACSPR